MPPVACLDIVPGGVVTVKGRLPSPREFGLLQRLADPVVPCLRNSLQVSEGAILIRMLAQFIGLILILTLFVSVFAGPACVAAGSDSAQPTIAQGVFLQQVAAAEHLRRQPLWAGALPPGSIPSSPYAQAVADCLSAGILLRGERVEPLAPLTRLESAWLISRTKDYRRLLRSVGTLPKRLPTFTDEAAIPVGSRRTLGLLKLMHVFTGEPNGSLDPSADLTVSQARMLLKRLTTQGQGAPAD